MNAEIKNELEAIHKKSGDTLRPRDVLAFAKANEGSAIHNWLEAKGAFDPEKSMERFGLSLCRQLIVSVKVEMPSREDTVHRVRGFTSLSEDQRHGGGYRKTEDILSHEQMRMALVRDAKRELTAVKKRYEIVTELADVWRAIEISAQGKAG